ncbi:MAG: SufE family protein [Deltaproteobacteria bacterium]|nr:SufE family protein [Deltaproteobacteria bacterium]
MDVAELVENFSLFSDWSDRYQYLIDLGRALPPMDDADKTEANRVKGCMSQVWIKLRVDDGRIDFDGDSDSSIVKGLVAVLRVVFVGQAAKDVRKVDLEGVFGQLGLAEHLSPNRRNGFFSMVELIRSLADKGPSAFSARESRE